MRSLRKPITLIGVYVLLFLVAGLVAVVAQYVRFPTYLYHGQILSMEEWIKTVEAGAEVHCGQMPTIEVALSDRAVSDYACFDTEAELDAYWDEFLQPEWDRLEQLYPNPLQLEPQGSGASALAGDHWAIYANSGYNTVLAEPGNGASYCGQSTPIWSIAEWYSLNTISLYNRADCSGDAYRYENSRWTFLPWPAECGGCRSARVD